MARRLARCSATLRRQRSRRRYNPTQRFVRPVELIHAPKSFDLLRGSGRDVVKFLRAVTAAVLDGKLAVRLDFRQTVSFYPPATVLLYATLDRIIAISSLDKPITILDPYALRPREVLKQIGIHELSNDRCELVPQREDAVYWRATKGATQSGDQMAMLKVVADRVNETQANALRVSGVWRGVSEAVANAVEHAYSRPTSHALIGPDDTRWWMFTQLRDETFVVTVCDVGCGYRATIGQSLPERFIAQCAALFARSNIDARAIRTAMAYGRSGTRESHRGKGSADAMSVIEKHGQGELFVVSNTGWMKYSFQAGHWSETEGALGVDIRGTILWWKLPLKRFP